MSRPQSKYVQVNSNDPSGAAECERCGRWWNLSTLSWQMEFAGTRLYNKRILVCRICLDKPAEFLRTIILPPDPLPLKNARVPDFDYEEQTDRIIQFADSTMFSDGDRPWGSGPMTARCDQSGNQLRIIQYLTQSAPGPAPYDRSNFFILGISELGGGDVLA